MPFLSFTVFILIILGLIFITNVFSMYKYSIILKEMKEKEEALKLNVDTLYQKLSDILVMVEKTKIESEFASSNSKNVDVISDFKSGVTSLISFLGDPVVVTQIVSTVIVGVTLFFVSYCLARYIHSEGVQTVVTNLYAGFLNTNKVTEHITADGDGTRQVLSEMLKDISSTASDITKHASNVSDASTLTLLREMDQKTVSFTKFISDNVNLLSGKNPKLFEKLLEIQTCLDNIKSDIKFLHIKVDTLVDAATFVSEAEANIDFSTLMTLCT
jgi:hypothetical protein